MNGKLAALALLAVGLAARAAMGANVARPVAGPGWIYIGTTHAQHVKDHDTILITGPHNRFRTLQVRVTDAPLRMQRMMVTYENGRPENVVTSLNVPKNGMSRAIPLRSGKRGLRQIDFWYETKGWLHGTADVSVFGVH